MPTNSDETLAAIRMQLGIVDIGRFAAGLPQPLKLMAVLSALPPVTYCQSSDMEVANASS